MSDKGALPVDLAEFRQLQRERDRARQGAEGALFSGGGGGTYDGMEPRVAILEKDVAEIKGDMKAVRNDLSEIKGKLSMMPSTLQMIGLIVGMVFTVFALCSGLGFALIRFALPT